MAFGICGGWAPKEQWRGPEDHWVDADEFIERGKTILPIMRENNQRLTADNQRMAGEIKELKELVQNGQASIEEFKKYHSEELKRQVTEARTNLRREIEQARKDGDVEGVVTLSGQLDELDETQRQLNAKPADGGKKPPNGEGGKPVELPADLKGWMADNQWYGSDPVKTALMEGLAAQYRNDPNADQNLKGRAFYDEIARRVDAYGKPERTPNKLEGGGGGGAGGSGQQSTSGFNALPPEAQAHARSQIPKFVGKGMMFEKEQDWLDYFAKYYEV